MTIKAKKPAGSWLTFQWLQRPISLQFLMALRTLHTHCVCASFSDYNNMALLRANANDLIATVVVSTRALFISCSVLTNSGSHRLQTSSSKQSIRRVALQKARKLEELGSLDSLKKSVRL
ncbi:unnamed protein product [Pieris brassicae]|uniref:Uncharacterized protein n=1 Tax=Pieris brassicae TaxID=7116 RepID=A0A9P0TFA8_PIEBR|nr:unnamed protein product [Pieris brassicae]